MLCLRSNNVVDITNKKHTVESMLSWSGVNCKKTVKRKRVERGVCCMCAAVSVVDAALSTFASMLVMIARGVLTPLSAMSPLRRCWIYLCWSSCISIAENEARAYCMLKQRMRISNHSLTWNSSFCSLYNYSYEMHSVHFKVDHGQVDSIGSRI